MDTVHRIAVTRTVRNRRAAMRRQAQRNRESAIYGCPVHAMNAEPPAPSAHQIAARKAYRAGRMAILAERARTLGRIPR